MRRDAVFRRPPPTWRGVDFRRCIGPSSSWSACGQLAVNMWSSTRRAVGRVALVLRRCSLVDRKCFHHARPYQWRIRSTLKGGGPIRRPRGRASIGRASIGSRDGRIPRGGGHGDEDFRETEVCVGVPQAEQLVKPRLHKTTGCQTGLTTGLTTGCIV